MAKIEQNIVPIKIAHLAVFISKRKRISLQEALTYIYINPMAAELYNEKAKWWYLDTESLYEEFEKKRKESDREVEFAAFEFYVFCLERYAEKAGMSSLQAMALFERFHADDFLIDNYDFLHTQDLSFVLQDIVQFIEKRR